ncbi:MAG TPA: glycosyltransferase [Clostridia bacterium]|nr:glycosyltransferase [Clostridia bacterium]
MKVLIVPSWYVTEDSPNNGIFFQEQAQALAQSGLEVSVIYPDLRFRLGELRKGLFRVEDAPVPTWIYRRRTLTPFWERGRWPQRALMLERLYFNNCREYGRPDVVHLHSCRMGVEVLGLCRRHNLPLVYTEHYSGVTGNMNAALRYAFHKTLSGCDAALAVSRNLRTIMTGIRSDVRYLPNMVDTDRFTIQKPAGSGGFRFGAVGNLIPVKGFDLLLRAFAEALPRMDGATLVIAGAGRLRGNLERMARELNLAGRVEFSGFVKRGELPGFYHRLGCLICSSRRETFGVTLIEALACGKPLIATRCGGPESIVTPRNGLLVKNGDAGDLARAMEEMYQHHKSYDPASLRLECEEEFGSRRVCDKITEVYRRVLRNG